MSKMVYVPSSAGRKGYTRMDPRTKKNEGKKSLITVLKDLLEKIVGLKKQGQFTKEQKAHIHKKLEELRPQLQHFKTQKQRQEVFNVMKQIRKELDIKVKESEKHEPLITKKRIYSSKEQQENLVAGLKRLGYSEADMKKMSTESLKAAYWNDIKKSYHVEGWSYVICRS